MTKAIKVLDSKKIYEGPVFELYEDTLQFADGHTSKFSCIKHGGAAVIVPFVDKDTVIMVKQYRHPFRSFVWEFPAGGLNYGEEPKDCANRELTEETGYKAGRLDYWGTVASIPSYTTELLYIYGAYDLTPTTQNLDEDEIMEVHTLTLGELKSMIKAGEIFDAKTLACLTLMELNNGK